MAELARAASLLLLVFASALATQGWATVETAPTQPNVLLIIADDLGWGDIGALGSEIPTPHIDSLAAEGVLFTNFHTAATCSPSRAMLLTGVDTHLAGLGNMITFMPPNQQGKPGYEGHLNERVRTLGELFQEAGYLTGFFGKWHLGVKLKYNAMHRGFDEFYGFMGRGAHDYFDLNITGLGKPVGQIVKLAIATGDSHQG